jgi:hypothetical protein
MEREKLPGLTVASASRLPHYTWRLNILLSCCTRLLYEGYFEHSETDKMTLTQFFRTTLEVPNATWRHFVDEIKHLNASNCTDFDRINSLYICLD